MPIQGDMRQDSMTSHYKPSYTHRITAILLPILSGLHLRDTWLGCEGSRVQNQDKTSWLLFILLSSFHHPSLPSHIRTPSTFGLRVDIFLKSDVSVLFVFTGFLDLFPGVPSKSLENMTVMTLCQRTQNNMTSWNAQVEQEREELLGIVSNPVQHTTYVCLSVCLFVSFKNSIILKIVTKCTVLLSILWGNICNKSSNITFSCELKWSTLFSHDAHGGVCKQSRVKLYSYFTAM